MTSGDDSIWLDIDQQRSWRAYIMGTTLLLDQLDRELRQAHGLGMGEYEILVRLSELPGRHMRMASLAEVMCYSRSRITHMVGRMEKAGLLLRRSADGDGRGIDAVMTDRGQRVLQEAAPTHVKGVRDHLVALGSPADFQAVGRVFDAVSDQLMSGHDKVADIR